MSSYPEIIRSSKKSEQTHSKSQNSLWLRISAFLSLKSPNTQETYKSIINEFCEFLGAKAGTETAAEKLCAVTDLHAIAYKEWLERRPGEVPRMLKHASSLTKERSLQENNTPRRSKKTGLEHTLSNATIGKKIVVLRRIYRLLVSAGLSISENPFEADRLPTPPKAAGRKRPTEMINFEKVMQVINSPNTQTTKGQRDQAILAVLFGAGLRRSEIIQLRIADVKYSSKGTCYLYLRATKAKRDAEQSLPHWAASILQAWIQVRIEQKAQPSNLLFPSYTGKGAQYVTTQALSASGVYKMFKMYCKQADAGEFVSPHSARATAITKLLEDGVPHREVQEFSRHSSIQMVEVYDKRRIGVDQNPAKGLNYSKKV